MDVTFKNRPPCAGVVPETPLLNQRSGDSPDLCSLPEIVVDMLRLDFMKLSVADGLAAVLLASEKNPEIKLVRGENFLSLPRNLTSIHRLEDSVSGTEVALKVLAPDEGLGAGVIGFLTEEVPVLEASK